MSTWFQRVTSGLSSNWCLQELQGHTEPSYQWPRAPSMHWLASKHCAAQHWQRHPHQTIFAVNAQAHRCRYTLHRKVRCPRCLQVCMKRWTQQGVVAYGVCKDEDRRRSVLGQSQIAHHCRQTMGSTKRSALGLRCPKICTSRSEGSAMMLVELTSSGWLCHRLRGNALRFLEPLARPVQPSSLLCFLCRCTRGVDVLAAPTRQRSLSNAGWGETSSSLLRSLGSLLHCPASCATAHATECTGQPCMRRSAW